MEEKSPQARRLQEFVDLTGYSVNEFAKQCLIPSTRTLTRILTDGGKPSPKILDKIIKRFPQLNHDWVVLGYGEMIVKGFENREVTAESLQKSTQSSFGNIQESLANHDYSLNELAKRVEKAISRVDTISDFLTQAAKSQLEKQILMEKLFFEKVENKMLEIDDHVTQLVFNLRERDREAREKEDERIKELDRQRRDMIEKDFSQLFKEFDRLSSKTKIYLDDARENLHRDLKMEAQNILSQSLEALSAGFESVKEKSNENTQKAMQALAEGLGTMRKHKKP